MSSERVGPNPFADASPRPAPGRPSPAPASTRDRTPPHAESIDKYVGHVEFVPEQLVAGIAGETVRALESLSRL